MTAARDIPVGYRYGRWTVLGSFERLSTGAAFFLCRCDCGVERKVQFRGQFLGKSCGCLQRDRAVELKTTHGASHTRLYRIYKGLFDRCYNPKDTSYHNYGGRGIYVVKSWRTFESFQKWALANGYEDHLQLDRINNDGPYSSTNCRWVTGKQNARNKRTTVWLTAWGETKSLQDWADDDRCSVGAKTLTTRIRLHEWDHEKAISLPKGSRPYKRSPNGTYRVPGTELRVRRTL